MRRKIIASFISFFLLASAARPEGLRERVRAVIPLAQNLLMAEMRDGTHWNYTCSLGTHYISQYFLMLEWFGRTKTELNASILAQKLADSQLQDGSWKAVRDPNLTSGDLNATIFNYWSLKAMGEDPTHDRLSRARRFILSHGGLMAGSMLTKLFLALFNQYPWSEMPRIPAMLFNENLSMSYLQFAQWVRPHIIAIAYLRHFAVAKELGERFDLSELFVRRPAPESLSRIRLVDARYHHLARKILKTQEPRGTWGGYTLSTLLSLAVLDDFLSRAAMSTDPITRATDKGFSALERLYFSNGELSGATQDGRYWDTVLAMNALTASRYQGPEIEEAANYIIEQRHADGGYPFGEDFWSAPDTDDTAETILALLPFERHKNQREAAVTWLRHMQNADGGWGAFDRDNIGTPLLTAMMKKFRDSVEPFDGSSADVTAHILEAFGKSGLTVDISSGVRRAVDYLRTTQTEGRWRGRWGVNYLYATSASVVGLTGVGVDRRDTVVKSAIQWLKSRQNQDGGFGETTASYTNGSLAGRGISTPTQTAWVVLALLAADSSAGPALGRGVEYLVQHFETFGGWNDAQAMGTGHPGLIYMEYPSYPNIFPLWAIGQYLDKATL